MKYIKYNPNPIKHNAGDCVIRMMTIAAGESWPESYSEFYRVAQKVEPAHLMATLDELVGCVQILDARLYQSFIQKLKGEEE